MKKTRPGAPVGNSNAQKTGEKNDGQLPIRLPRERLPRMKTATRITGDSGLADMVRRLIDQELNRVEGAKVGVIVDQAEAERVLRDAGHEPPKIKAGASTAELWFSTAEGRPALAINQTGFARDARDAEPVNGCTVLVLVEGGLTDEEARRAIEAALKQMTS